MKMWKCPKSADSVEMWKAALFSTKLEGVVSRLS